MSDHKQWLDNEYHLWIEALQSSTVDNFKEHPQVKRMLGEVKESFPLDDAFIKAIDNSLLLQIDNIWNGGKKK